jgi:hypothetical protein
MPEIRKEQSGFSAASAAALSHRVAHFRTEEIESVKVGAKIKPLPLGGRGENGQSDLEG